MSEKNEMTRTSSFDGPLKIAAFKDITAFVLETGKRENLFNIDVRYLKDADEAHGLVISINFDYLTKEENRDRYQQIF